MASLEGHQALIEWVVANGGFCHEHIQTSCDHERGYHLQVKPNMSISAEACLVRCPMECILTVLNALDTPPFSSHGTRFPGRFITSQTPHVIQYFFLMEQKVMGGKSWWAPYIKTLQDPGDLPEFAPFEMADLPWIRGTNLESALRSQFNRWKELFDQGLRELVDLQWPSAVEGRYTWRLFVWAVKQFDSRSFTPALLGDTLPAEKATRMGSKLPDHDLLTRMFRESFSVMIPLLDLTSHKPMFAIEWKHNMHYIGIDTAQPLGGGEEVCNNYGPKGNETLLLAYGFTLRDNPFDLVLINVRAPLGSPLEEARTIWRERDLDRESAGTLYIMSTAHPNSKNAESRQQAIFSHGLLASMSTLRANEREMRTDRYNNERTLIDVSSLDNPWDWQRNHLATFAQLAVECRARLQMLDANDPRTQDLPAVPSNAVQTYAQIYRDGQYRILNCAYQVCCYELFCARSDHADPEGYFERHMDARRVPKESREEVRKCIKDKAVHNETSNVLLSSKEASAILDQDAKAGLEAATEEIKAGNIHGEEATVPSPILSKAQLTTFVAFVRLSHQRDPSSLSSRLQKWFKVLEECYPLDRPDLLLPTEELLPLLEPLLNVLPDEEWSQELLCWAWSVMDEEALAVSIEAVGSTQSLDGGMNLGIVTEFLIYVPKGEDM